MKVGNYRYIVRIIAGIFSFILWFASIRFSLDGFGLQISADNRSSLMWVGWSMAAFVTVMELVWNRKDARMVPTLFVAGIMAYAYGVFTNVAGFYSLQGGTLDKFSDNPATAIFALVVGFICEVVPEALLVWAVLDGQEISESDFIGNILGVHESHEIKAPPMRRNTTDTPKSPFSGNDTSRQPISPTPYKASHRPQSEFFSTKER